MDAKKIEEVPFEEVYEVEKYGTYYSENKFWQKVQRVAKKVGATVIRPVFQLYYLLHLKIFLQGQPPQRSIICWTFFRSPM